MEGSRVFVTQLPRPNGVGWAPSMRPAAEFGELRYVFAAEEKPHASPKVALLTAALKLEDFDPERDYILWPSTGDPAAAWAVMLYLGRAGYKAIKTLYWERSLTNGSRGRRDSGYYTVITYQLEGMDV